MTEIEKERDLTRHCRHPKVAEVEVESDHQLKRILGNIRLDDGENDPNRHPEGEQMTIMVAPNTAAEENRHQDGVVMVTTTVLVLAAAVADKIGNHGTRGVKKGRSKKISPPTKKMILTKTRMCVEVSSLERRSKCTLIRHKMTL